MSDLPEQRWSLWERADTTPPPPAPRPDEVWTFPGIRDRGGEARVYYGTGHRELRRPVILSDGFNSGPSNFDAFWQDLNERDFAFATKLRDQRQDLILLGYAERSASILDNAAVAIDCIRRAGAQRLGNTPLVVGGFSMGGLITRYALARMESDKIEHQTGVYLSFDSPHRGAWIPISLQALAHFLTIAPAMSQQINSAAARQLLWQHIATVDGIPEQDPLRTEFLAALRSVGDWPQKPRKLAVANGLGDGRGNGVPPGAVALECTKGGFKPTTLRTQTLDSRVILAHLKDMLRDKDVRTRGLPPVDGAPGGMLNTFEIAANSLTNPQLGLEAIAYHPAICFVPSISAVSILDIEDKNLTADIGKLDPSTSDLDEFFCSTTGNTMHSEMTPELGQWILKRLLS